MNGWIVLLWSAVAILVLAVCGIFGSMVAMGKITFGPEDTLGPSPTPTEVGVVDTTYGVLVLNATAADGLAATMRDTIVNAGWSAEAVLTGNADLTDFPETTVYYVNEADRLAALGLAEVIGGAKIAQSDAYAVGATDGPGQLTVVIGVDRAPAPEVAEDDGGDDSSDESAE